MNTLSRFETNSMTVLYFLLSKCIEKTLRSFLFTIILLEYQDQHWLFLIEIASEIDQSNQSNLKESHFVFANLMSSIASLHESDYRQKLNEKFNQNRLQSKISITSIVNIAKLT